MANESDLIVAFGEDLLDDDRTTFTFAEACELANSLGHMTPVKIIRALKEYGFECVRPHAAHVRGVTTSSEDRWFGPGSSRTFGGSGHEQISGFAGYAG